MFDPEMRAKAEMLARRIPGTRRGVDEPAFIHSFRVAETLERYGFSEEVIIGGLLHDVIEDSETTFEELVEEGFSSRVIDLVRLCSHDDEIKESDARWVMMVAKLVEANDREAWAIKLADINDNLDSCHLLFPDRCKLMKEAKAPLLLSLTAPLLAGDPLWRELGQKLERMAVPRIPAAQP
jgi:(p)ppGpp synthase/HD superfamily hydrolase